jgi:hypothetical protein
MGHPQRAAQSRHDDPFVSVQDWFDDEESGPWCVDSGAAIQVMTTRAVYEGVENGELSPDMKVWRDGRACWLPIAECYELTVKPSPRRDPTPVSGIRRVRPVSDSMTAPTLPPRERRSLRPRARDEQPTLMLTTSFAIGLVIGALLYLPFAW